MAQHNLRLGGVRTLLAHLFVNREHEVKPVNDTVDQVENNCLLVTHSELLGYHGYWQNLAELPLFMDNAHDLKEELLRLEQLWRLYRKRLQLLEEQEAKQGIGANAAITMEIEELQNR